MRPDSFPSSPARIPVIGKNSHGRTVRESSSRFGVSCACWLTPVGADTPMINAGAIAIQTRLVHIDRSRFRIRAGIPREMYILVAPLRRALALPRWPYYKRKRRILARGSQGKVPLLLSSTRRAFLQSLSRSALILPLEKLLALARPKKLLLAAHAAAAPSEQSLGAAPPNDLGVAFLNVARESGLNAKTIFGGEHKNKYLLETTGCGVAVYDYDNDGWLDIFLVNGTRLEGFAAGREPTSHLFRNNRDGTFTDVTLKAGVAHSGWGQGCCVGDYDNDGWDDLYVTYFGKNVLYHNNGDGTFTDVRQKAGVAGTGKRWNTG